ncbi:hypothetical protein E4U21_002639 [Claviceps maximensis]|nr:hypothetical protein E4U21_002639 [Claviceps maximensis]
MNVATNVADECRRCVSPMHVGTVAMRHRWGRWKHIDIKYAKGNCWGRMQKGYEQQHILA